MEEKIHCEIFRIPLLMWGYDVTFACINFTWVKVWKLQLLVSREPHIQIEFKFYMNAYTVFVLLEHIRTKFGLKPFC